MQYLIQLEQGTGNKREKKKKKGKTTFLANVKKNLSRYLCLMSY
jgi:hypothetical protein